MFGAIGIEIHLLDAVAKKFQRLDHAVHKV